VKIQRAIEGIALEEI